MTVIMTVHNEERRIASALRSVLAQTLRELEVVVVDDGSTDATVRVVEEVAAGDPRVRVLPAGRVGRARALNLAWRAGSGRYVANLDADDEATPERLERQTGFLEAHPEIGVLGAAYHQEGAGMTGVRMPPLDDASLRRALLDRNPILHSSVMMRRSALEAAGGYNERYPFCLDYELWVRLAERHALANLPDALSIKRFSDEQYFRNRFSSFHRARIHLAIRWNAWRRLSRSPGDLVYIVRALRQLLRATIPSRSLGAEGSPS